MTEAEFDSTYREHVSRIHRYCLFRLNCGAEAEDATAEAFARLLGRASRLSPEAALPWLFAVARNLCTDALRQRGRGVSLHEAHETHAEPFTDAPWHDPGVWAALGALTPSEQSVVYLRAVEDLPFSRVARLVGKREGAVKMTYRRALGRLALALGEEV